MENSRPLLSLGLLQATCTLDCQPRTRDEEAGVERDGFHHWSLGFLALDLQGLQKLRVTRREAHVLQVEGVLRPGHSLALFLCQGTPE